MALDITTTLHHLTNNTNYHTLQVYSITLNEPTRESFTRKFAVKTCQQNDGYRYVMRLWYAVFICMYTHKYIVIVLEVPLSKWYKFCNGNTEKDD